VDFRLGEYVNLTQCRTLEIKQSNVNKEILTNEHNLEFLQRVAYIIFSTVRAAHILVYYIFCYCCDELLLMHDLFCLATAEIYDIIIQKN